MLVKVEYRQQIHKINLFNIRDLRELEETTRKCFAILPHEFCFLINDPDNTIMDNDELSRLKKSNRSAVKLKIKDVRADQSDLISVQSDRESSFSKLQESMVSQNIPVRESIEIIHRTDKPAEWRRDGSIFITSRYEEVKTFKEETTQYFHVQTSEVIHLPPKKMEEQKQSILIIKREDDEISQLTNKLEQLQILQQNRQLPKEEEKIIFDNIQCDICCDYPIKGPVFKCLICQNFDLCQNCEAVYHHFHPTLQMTKKSHYPTSIRIVMPEPSKQIQQLLQEEKDDIKKQKLRGINRPQKRQEEQVDPRTLKSSVIKAPSFVAQLLGVHCNN